MFQVKFWVNDLVPNEGNPSARDKNKEKGVDDHVENPEDYMRSEKLNGICVIIIIASVYLVLKDVSMRITPIPLRITKLAKTYHLNRGSCSFKYSLYHCVLLKKRKT